MADFPPDAPRVAIARTGAAVEKLRATWQQLQEHPDADYALHRALTVARTGDADPFVVTVGDPARPRALCVGRRYLACLAWCPDRATRLAAGAYVIEIPRGGLLGIIDDHTARLIVARLRSELRQNAADTLLVDDIPTDHPLATALRARGARTIATTEQHWTIRLPDNWRDLSMQSTAAGREVAAFEGAFEAQLGRRFRILAYRNTQNLSAIVDALSTLGDHSPGSTAAGTHGEQRVRLEAALRERHYRAFVLEIDGRPAAFCDGRAYRSAFHLGQYGERPEYAEAMPARYLLLRVVRDLCADVDLERFECDSAEVIAALGVQAAEREELRVVMFAPTLRARLLHGLGVLIMWLARLLGRAADPQRWLRRRKTRRPAEAIPQFGHSGSATGPDAAGPGATGPGATGPGATGPGGATGLGGAPGEPARPERSLEVEAADRPVDIQ